LEASSGSSERRTNSRSATLTLQELASRIDDENPRPGLRHLTAVHVVPSRGSAKEKHRSGIEERERPAARDSGVRAEVVATGKRIVIVDDEEDIIAVLSLMVRKWGYVVEATASDAAHVVDAIAKKELHPEVVLTDYRMKAMNGLDAAEKIRLIDPSIMVIIESADESIRPEVMKAGLTFLQKPFTAAQLEGALSEALKGEKADR
jgi:CheY-like chemotaxis protein